MTSQSWFRLFLFLTRFLSILKLLWRWNNIETFIREKKGSSIVIFALAFTAIIAFLSLGADSAILYYNQAKIQNATDAAAFTGANYLPDNSSRATEQALAYARLNHVENPRVEISANHLQIKVIGELSSPLIISSQKTLTARSTVQISPVMTVKEDILPLALEVQPLLYGHLIHIKNGGGEGTNGWYGPIRLGGTGANVFQNNLIRGYSGTLSVGDIVNVETGNMDGPTRQGVNTRLASDVTGNTYFNYTKDAPQIGVLPMVQRLDHGRVEIKGFAVLFIEGEDGHGGINGRFLEMVAPGSMGASTVTGFDDNYGLYQSKLIQ